MNPKTQWYVKPVGDAANEQIATLLSSEGITSGESEITSIEVNGKTVRGVYLVEYWVIDRLEKSDFHHKNFRAYRKVGNGKILPWFFQGRNRKKLAGTPSVEQAKKQLEARIKGD